MFKQGFYWHVHHDLLLEWCYDYDERARVIKMDKPSYEWNERLKRFEKVRGELPREFRKAGKAFGRAQRLYLKHCARHRRWQWPFETTLQHYDRIRTVYVRVLVKYSSMLEKLHTEECPGCSWDGQMHFEGR